MMRCAAECLILCKLLQRVFGGLQSPQLDTQQWSLSAIWL